MALSFTTDNTTVPSISFLVTSGGLIWYNLPKSLKHGWSYVRWVPHCTTLSSVWSLLPLDTCQGHATRNHPGSGVCCILYACKVVPSPSKPMGSGRLVDGATRVTCGRKSPILRSKPAPLGPLRHQGQIETRPREQAPEPIHVFAQSALRPYPYSGLRSYYNHDDDVLTPAHFPTTLPVVIRQAVTKCISMGENKHVRNCVHIYRWYRFILVPGMVHVQPIGTVCTDSTTIYWQCICTGRAHKWKAL